MKIVELNVKDALLFESPKYVDQRGYFFESYSEKTFRLGYNFVQDNQSSSTRNVLRGLHYQIKNPQGKLVRCIRGSVLDTIVDLRLDINIDIGTDIDTGRVVDTNEDMGTDVDIDIRVTRLIHMS